MKTAISLPDDLFEVAERAAQRLGLTRSELFRRALVAFLGSDGNAHITDSLNEVYAAAGDGVDPAIRLIQARSVSSDEW